MNNPLEFDIDLTFFTEDHLDAKAHSHTNREVWDTQEENLRLQGEVNALESQIEGLKGTINNALDFANACKKKAKDAANESEHWQRMYLKEANKREVAETLNAYNEGKSAGQY